MIVAAIVGRSNVGKSSLFNCLTGKRLALVASVPGVTRDFRDGSAKLGDISFKVIDTAGFEDLDSELSGRVRAQIFDAVDRASVLFFVVDAQTGITSTDKFVATLLRRFGKPVILIANKAETRSSVVALLDSFSLGFGDPVSISAKHREGLADLYASLLDYIRNSGDTVDTACENEKSSLKICVVGRPNTGKSTLINRLINKERLLVGSEAGTTRDSISIKWCWKDRQIELCDTAGMRRKAKIQDSLEQLSVSDTLRCIKFADVVVVCMTVTEPFEQQDLYIASLVEREGRGLVIAINKWDLVAPKDKDRIRMEMLIARDNLLPQIQGAALVPTSGLKGDGLNQLMSGVIKTHNVWNRRVNTSRLNSWLTAALKRHPPPRVAGYEPKIKYATQIKTRPPHFALFASRVSSIQADYLRYLVNDIKRQFSFLGVPVRISLRSKMNPYVGVGHIRK